MKDKTMHIGEAAAQVGVNLRTLHYYERRGLLQPERTPSNYRIYTRETVRRVRFIKQAQELGFTLEETKELLALRIDRKATCGDVRERAKAKVAGIDGKIRTLRAMKRSLERLIAACSGNRAVSECPILESLDKHGRNQ